MDSLGKQLMEFVDKHELVGRDGGERAGPYWVSWDKDAEAKLNEFLTDSIEKAANEKFTALALGEAGLLLTKED